MRLGRVLALVLHIDMVGRIRLETSWGGKQQYKISDYLRMNRRFCKRQAVFNWAI